MDSYQHSLHGLTSNLRNAYTLSLTAKYLYRKILEKLLLQLLQTRDLAALTEEAGLDEIKRWLQLDVDEEALTPLTYRLRSANRRPSVYVLDEAKCK